MIQLSGLIIGILTGLVFQRGRACTNTAFRNILVIKDFNVAFIFFVAVLIEIIGYFVLSLNLIPGVMFQSQPLYFSYLLLPLGGFIFGIGMVIAGGCAGGVCYRVGEGSGNSLMALIGYIAGLWLLIPFLTQFNQLNQATGITIAGKIPSLEQFLPRWFWTIIALLAFIGSSYLYLRKHPDLLPHLRKNWAPIITGVLLGFLGIAARLSSMLTGRQFGFSTVDGILEFAGPFVNGIEFGWAGLFVIGLILGAFLSSLQDKEFNLRFNKKASLRFLIGGILLGIGAMLAGGCNIGHILGGIPELGISSFVALIFMALGNFTASYLYYLKFKIEPLPESSQLQSVQ